MTRLRVRALGVDVVVDLTVNGAVDHAVDHAVDDVSGPVASQLAALWSDCGAAPDATAAQTVELSRDGDGWRATAGGQTWWVPGKDAAVSAASTAINHLVTTRTALLAFHAAVVTRGGVTAVLPGRSGAGKTTLTLALLQRGWSYVTDEAFALGWDAAALVPYPRPMAVADWTRRALVDRTGSAPSPGLASGGETWLSAADLGASTSDGSVAPSLVVLLDRRDGAVRLESPPRSQAIAALVPRAFTLHRDPAAALEVLGGLCRASTVVRVSYGDAREAADALTELVTGWAGCVGPRRP